MNTRSNLFSGQTTMQLDYINAWNECLALFLDILQKIGKKLFWQFFSKFAFFGLFFRNLQQKSGFNLMITPKTLQIPKIQYYGSRLKRMCIAPLIFPLGAEVFVPTSKIRIFGCGDLGMIFGANLSDVKMCTRGQNTLPAYNTSINF